MIFPMVHFRLGISNFGLYLPVGFPLAIFPGLASNRTLSSSPRRAGQLASFRPWLDNDAP